MKIRLIIVTLAFALVVLMALRREVAPPSNEMEPAPATGNSFSIPKGRPLRTIRPPRVASTAPAVQPSWIAALAALDELDRETAQGDPDLREARLQALLAALPQAEVPQLLAELARGEPTQTRLEFSRRLARRWAERDPAAAAAWAAELPEGTFAQGVLGQAVIVWANADLEAAAGWARALPDGDAKTATLTKIGFEAIRTMPIEALRIATELAPGSERDHLAVQGAREWAAQDPQAAADWTQGITDDSLREKLLGAIAADYGERDPILAAQFALDTLPPGQTQNHALVGIVQRWAQTDPDQAGQWVSQFPESALRRDAAQNLVALWGRQDLAAVGHWLSEQPPGPSRDTAVSTYVSQLARSAPGSDVLVPWLEEIADAGLRERTRAGLAVDGKAP